MSETLRADGACRESADTILSGRVDGAILDGAAFADGAAIIGENPARILEGAWDDWGALEEAWTAGRAHATGEGGVAGWFDYDGNFRFGVFPSWRRGHLPHHGSHPPPHPPRTDFRPGLAQDEWTDLVRRAHCYIAAGDIYQVNLTHALSSPWEVPPGGFYPFLRGKNPPPCSAFLSLGDTAVLSASPEMFLRVDGRGIMTRPIKGTRPRGENAKSDAAAIRELTNSAKERAELVMITDLLRNDLGQVCGYGSVNVPDLCRLETFTHVHHLVSTVRGTLRPDVTPFDALRACYPGGSITGAPKKRAREIIAELEPVPRGIYTGAIGYVDWKGRAMFSIAIRTLIVRDGLATYGIGAGIVADSDPRLEYEETLHKAAGLAAALGRNGVGFL